uniref:Uncharacterized protein n=1 Tax=Vespula pensylvanica TaxID=30213 RepID=A0A834P7Y2_VESPE|nr:hypothetical protein H0235_004797 [Vespula pensylvanica]
MVAWRSPIHMKQKISYMIHHEDFPYPAKVDFSSTSEKEYPCEISGGERESDRGGIGDVQREGEEEEEEEEEPVQSESSGQRTFRLATHRELEKLPGGLYVGTEHALNSNSIFRRDFEINATLGAVIKMTKNKRRLKYYLCNVLYCYRVPSIPDIL